MKNIAGKLTNRESLTLILVITPSNISNVRPKEDIISIKLN